ncbi:Zn(II)2Cys6 transcription factor [Aspergillus ruber CBS 135680]|uniref:Fungal-specific transcription factor n=1 Tax=Aspergillus ruber (strain CBS 135680) TaxID=1388766 RepID=A0A017S1I8_ASPRC|nr:fungal-specific transcription factor [Aspergillus ruber CBS 135680]EYE90691.1 fungal-specific transcription factor [Aspergillus ruber CBS 135680]
MPVHKPPKFHKKKPVACQRCHAHKVKCSGDQPCARCRHVGRGEECQYSLRDRKLKINESYLDQILAENDQLRTQLYSRQVSITSDASGFGQAQRRESSSTSPVRNPLLGDRAWFYPYDSSAPPIYMGEAACTAFATRLRQFLTGNPGTAHVARTQYTPESALVEAETQWPRLPQARLLVRVAFNQLSRVYHLVLRKATLDQLEDLYKFPGKRDDPAWTAKFFALFALGEVYSSRADSAATAGGRVPGTGYYVRAMGLISILPERPGIVHMESLLLLSLFSYFLNRRHSGYTLIGTAMRIGLILGLNHNIPKCQCPDPIESEHRVRIWWAVYIFDRMWGSKTGFPLQIRDEDIHVDLPKEVSSPTAAEQFSDTAYLVASVQLARIVGLIIEKIYSRKEHRESFLQREQQLLLALQGWMQDLPAHIRLPSDEGLPAKHIVSLHLQFNQCVILATRPILLHALYQHHKPTKTPQMPQAVITLSEACIHAARHSHSLVVDEWINGSLPMYGYFYAQYLFSSTLTLVISSLLGSSAIGNTADTEALETGIEILHRMTDHGNLAAAEFYENLIRVKETLNPSTTFADEDYRENNIHEHNNNSSVYNTPDAIVNLPDLPNASTASGIGFTTEMAFLEPTMQEFLGRSGSDMDLVQPEDLSLRELDSWPTLWTS